MEELETRNSRLETLFMIVIGSDHAGYPLKELLKQKLLAKGLEVFDAGCDSGDSVDYPDFGAKVAAKVSTGAAGKGILICGSGIGMSIVANKFPGVRAALCFDEEMARMSRLHNDSNILVLAGRWVDDEKASRILETWMATPFEAGRHARRLEKIAELEKRICKEGVTF